MYIYTLDHSKSYRNKCITEIHSSSNYFYVATSNKDKLSKTYIKSIILKVVKAGALQYFPNCKLYTTTSTQACIVYLPYLNF